MKICRCHSDQDLYGALGICPSCGHRSYDRWASACERRACAYAGPEGCGADWGSATASQRCKRTAGHEGVHIDQVGREFGEVAS